MTARKTPDEEPVMLRIPAKPTIDLAPQLAVLSLLDANIMVARRALAAAHPNTAPHQPGYSLHCPSPVGPSPASTAQDIITLLTAVRFGIESYRRLVVARLPWNETEHDDIPF